MKKFLKVILIVLIVCIGLIGCLMFIGDDEEDYEPQVAKNETNNTYDETEEEVVEKAAEPVKSAESEEEDSEESYPVGNGTNISFDTVDVNGNPVSTDMIKDAKIVMLNLWEPWCGPCVSEMPELNQLYEDYKDKGLLIIGSYSSFDMDSDAKDIVNKISISYPIIKANKSINGIAQDYVPATYILDHNGNLITEEPLAGSKSYDQWEAIIREYIE